MWVDVMSCMEFLDCCMQLMVRQLPSRVLAFQEMPEVFQGLLTDWAHVVTSWLW